MSEPERGFSIISGALDRGWHAENGQEDLDGTAEVEERRLVVPVDGHGGRLDRILTEVLTEFSRSFLQQLIDAGGVSIGGLCVRKPSTRVKAGDEIVVELRPTLQSQAFKAQAMDLDIVFEDDFLLVINKPAGLVVHPAPGNWSGTLLNGLLARDPQAAFLPRAGIVHRLDKDTSGVMVVARRRETMDRLVALIAARKVSREYVALAHGAWQGAKSRRVMTPIGRDPRNRLRMATVDLEKNSGKTACTVITLLENAKRHCLVSCALETGRTHQIRVHMASIGHPLVSDVLYAGAIAAGLRRQALHACRLAFDHPATHAAMAFNSPLPPDMSAGLAELGLRYNEQL